MSESEEKPKSLIDRIDLVSLVNLGRKKPRHDNHYGGFNRRMMAITIDSFFLALLEPFFDWLAPVHQEALESVQPDFTDPNFASHALVQTLTSQEFMISWFVNLCLQMFVFCILSGICWHFWSATPGKMLLRMKIVDATTEQRITDQQIFKRLCGYWVSCFALMMGIFWIGFDKKKRGWHDMMANTVVITLPITMPWKKKKKEIVAEESHMEQGLS